MRLCGGIPAAFAMAGVLFGPVAPALAVVPGSCPMHGHREAPPVIRCCCAIDASQSQRRAIVPTNGTPPGAAATVCAQPKWTITADVGPSAFADLQIPSVRRLSILYGNLRI
jgi:hypothetical protein